MKLTRHTTGMILDAMKGEKITNKEMLAGRTMKTNKKMIKGKTTDIQYVGETEEKCGQVFIGEETLSWMYGKGGQL